VAVSTISEKIWRTNSRSWGNVLRRIRYHQERNAASYASRKKTARTAANTS
jgi:hypothetical protein